VTGTCADRSGWSDKTKTNNMIRHVLFDNDGTIVDTEIIAVNTILELLAEYGHNSLGRDYFCRRFTGMLERDIFALLASDHGIEVPVGFSERLHTLHEIRFEQPLPGIAGMPELFRRLRTPKSMVSNASLRHVSRCLTHLDLHSALDGQIFSAEQVDRPKPFPDVYQYALAQLQLQPADVIVVEDSIPGVTAAKSAGLQVIGFLGAAHIGDGHAEKLADHGADFLAENAAAVEKIFEKLLLL
jgi:beta-phosphoglucomutase-like phosphatase (HAD superfamily)